LCTYTTEYAELAGSSAKGRNGWFQLSEATVYFDHPVHAQAEHTLNIDFADPTAGPSGRIGLELTAASARELVAAIERALGTVPPGLLT
jgi:hypothetical protein